MTCMCRCCRCSSQHPSALVLQGIQQLYCAASCRCHQRAAAALVPAAVPNRPGLLRPAALGVSSGLRCENRSMACGERNARCCSACQLLLLCRATQQYASNSSAPCNRQLQLLFAHDVVWHLWLGADHVRALLLQVLLGCLIVPAWLALIRELLQQQQLGQAAALAVGGLAVLLACDAVHRQSAAARAAAAAATVTAATVRRCLPTGEAGCWCTAVPPDLLQVWSRCTEFPFKKQQHSTSMMCCLYLARSHP